MLEHEYGHGFLSSGGHDYWWESETIFWRQCGKQANDASDPRQSHSYGAYTSRTGTMGDSGIPLYDPAIRAHYYVTCGSGHGEDKRVEQKLVELGFTPYVDPVSKNDRETYDRIDVQLASHFIGNAYRDNYEIALLISGDGDYIPAVREVQRCGKIVILAGFDHPKGGLNSELKMVCDYFVDLCDCLLDLDES